MSAKFTYNRLMNLLERFRSRGSRTISERVKDINKTVVQKGKVVIAGETLPPGPKYIGWAGNCLRVAVRNGAEATIYKIEADEKGGVRESIYTDKAFDPREW